MDIKNYDTIMIETERLVLQKGSIEDFVAVYEYDMTKLRDIAGEFKYEMQDKQEIRNWFDGDADAYYQKCANEDKQMDWIVYLKSTMQPIGNITANRENQEMRACELSYNLHPSFWGQGYMPEALVGVLNHLFEVGYDNIILGWDDGNQKSKRVSEKLGFELFQVVKNSWVKNGIPITGYKSVMNKEKWHNLNKNKIR